MLIQFAFFGSYFVFSIPSAKLIDWIGYQRSMVAGLLTMGLGRISVRSGGECSVVSTVSGGADCFGGRNHVFAGCGESLRDGSGQAGNRFESPESDAGLQFVGHISGSVFRRDC